MKKFELLILALVLVLVVSSLHSCRENIKASVLTEAPSAINQVYQQDTLVNLVFNNSVVPIEKSVAIENYFQFMDSLVKTYDTLTSYQLTEHLLVRANSWIIDTLQNTDYYRNMARDSFVYNPKKMIALPKGNSILIPDSIQAQKLLNTFQNSETPKTYV